MSNIRRQELILMGQKRNKVIVFCLANENNTETSSNWQHMFRQGLVRPYILESDTMVFRRGG